MASSVTKASFWVVVLRVMCGLLALVGCASSDSQGDPFKPGTGKFAQRCAKSEDCASGLCVRLDAQSGICSDTCTSAGDCPTANNWACLPAGSGGLEVCACRLLGSSESCGDGADNDCDGRVDDCRMCDGRLAPSDDPQNCGTCGTVCSGGRVCRDEKCQCQTSDLVECGPDCVDTRSNANHCGGCNQRCSSAEVCKDGTCQCPDAKASDYCDGIGCVDLATDVANCGTCGTACPGATQCRGGACVCPSLERPDFCPGVGCIVLDNDANHCGTCDTSCKLGQQCVGGKCTCSPNAPDFCGGVGCVDFASDRYNCGGCSNACPSGQSCSLGKCVCTDSKAPDFCEGSGCVDLTADSKNCGACGKECQGVEVCVKGACQCPAGRLLCNGACVDPTSDAKNCGECGNSCGVAQACVSGVCGCSAPGYTACGTECVGPLDPAHCGGCNIACGAGEVCFHGNCLCPSGLVCDGVCTPGDGNDNCGACGVKCAANQYCAGNCVCQGAGLTACGDQCVDLVTDEANCGLCGRACAKGQECINGTCGCAWGQTYCEASAACVTTSSDKSHCGSCDKACRATELCQNGQCACPNWNETFCAETGACTSIYDNDAHCGACGHACPAGTHCSSNACVCDQVGQSLCGDDCYDLSRDGEHCGSCDKACAAPLTCAGGTCSCPLPSVGPAVRITTNSKDDARPSLAWDGTHAALAYVRTAADGSGELRIALLNSDASVISDNLVSAFDAFHWIMDAPSLVWTGSEYGLAWLQQRPEEARFHLEFQRFNETLVAKGAPLEVEDATDTNQNAYSVSLAFGTGGYAVAYVDVSTKTVQDRVRFRKLGNDGTALGSTNSVPLRQFASPASTSLAIAPDGSYAVAAGYPYTIILNSFNADGSRTAPGFEFLDDTNSDSPRPHIAYGSSDWLFTFSAGTAFDLVLNRGTTRAYSPLVNASGKPIRASLISVNDGLLSVVYTQPRTSTSGDLIRFQRFKLPTTSSPYVTALHAPIDVLSTENYPAPGGFALTSTGSRSSLVVWSDNRWDTARELYAAVVDAGMCP